MAKFHVYTSRIDVELYGGHAVSVAFYCQVLQQLANVIPTLNQNYGYDVEELLGQELLASMEGSQLVDAKRVVFDIALNQNLPLGFGHSKHYYGLTSNDDDNGLDKAIRSHLAND